MHGINWNIMHSRRSLKVLQTTSKSYSAKTHRNLNGKLQLIKQTEKLKILNKSQTLHKLHLEQQEVTVNTGNLIQSSPRVFQL